MVGKLRYVSQEITGNATWIRLQEEQIYALSHLLQGHLKDEKTLWYI